MNYKLGDTHIEVIVQKSLTAKNPYWLCTAQTGGNIIAQVEFPYSEKDNEKDIEYEFCRLVAWELSIAMSALLVSELSSQ